jgi:hypothetical protein
MPQSGEEKKGCAYEKSKTFAGILYARWQTHTESLSGETHFVPVLGTNVTLNVCCLHLSNRYDMLFGTFHYRMETNLRKAAWTVTLLLPTPDEWKKKNSHMAYRRQIPSGWPGMIRKITCSSTGACGLFFIRTGIQKNRLKSSVPRSWFGSALFT